MTNDSIMSKLAAFDPILLAHNEEENELITSALFAVSGMCDHAMSTDGVGFNKDDYQRGHDLAECAAAGMLSTGEQIEAKRLLYKYWRQIPEEVYLKLYGKAGG